MKTETIGLAGYYKALVPEKWPKTGKNACITAQPLLNLIIMKRRDGFLFLTETVTGCLAHMLGTWVLECRVT